VMQPARPMTSKATPVVALFDTAVSCDDADYASSTRTFGERRPAERASIVA
jgi:hypothetical protein